MAKKITLTIETTVGGEDAGIGHFCVKVAGLNRSLPLEQQRQQLRSFIDVCTRVLAENDIAAGATPDPEYLQQIVYGKPETFEDKTARLFSAAINRHGKEIGEAIRNAGGVALDPDDVAEALAQNEGAQAVFKTLHEIAIQLGILDKVNEISARNIEEG